MLPLQEVTTDLPAALFLFGFVNRVFQEARHQIWNRNCSLISLEAEERCWGGKPPPATTPLCSLFSSERITGFIPQTHPTPLPFSVPQSPYFSRYTITSIQKRDNRNWPLWLKHYICTANWKYRKVYPIKPQWMCTCSQSLPEIFAS